MTNRIDITLPLSKWETTEPDYALCMKFCEERIKELRKKDSKQNPVRMSKYRVIPEAEIYIFCWNMCRAATRFKAEFLELSATKKEVTFSFGISDERRYDEFYYHLVYLMASRGILCMQDCLKRKQKGTV